MCSGWACGNVTGLTEVIVARLFGASQVLRETEGGLPTTVLCRLGVRDHFVNLLDNVSGVERALFASRLTLYELGDIAGFHLCREEHACQSEVVELEPHDGYVQIRESTTRSMRIKVIKAKDRERPVQCSSEVVLGMSEEAC